MLVQVLLALGSTYLVAGWSPVMPGGMKLGLEGEIFSFDTKTCPGGIFFKRPIHIPLICSNGYFLRRRNGCKATHEIISGKNFACSPLNDDTSSLTQAIIPLTNPDLPHAHTLTFYDDGASLKNFRRYTYVRGVDGEYAGNNYNATDAIIVNSEETPKMSVGPLCYQGKDGSHSAAYHASLPRTEGGQSKLFEQGCDGTSYVFPWKTAHRYPMTKSFSMPDLFDNEIRAVLSYDPTPDKNDFEKVEIWNGLAYCLQIKYMQMGSGEVQPLDLNPSMEQLTPFCSDGEGDKTDNSIAVSHAALGGQSLFRTKRRAIVGALIKCMECCWKFWGKEEAKKAEPGKFTPADTSCCNQGGVWG